MTPDARDLREFVIAGAGLSGLTLAAELAATFEDRPLLVVDPVAARVGLEADAGNTGETFDRTIGFWTGAETPPFAELIERSWSELTIEGPGGVQLLDLGARRYHALRWSRLRDHLLEQLRAHPQVELRRGRVEALVEDGDSLVALVEGQAVRTRYAFDSRLDLDALTRAPGRVLGWQRFVGMRVELDEARFDPERATFMDLRPSDASRVAFINLLPERPETALVYHVEIGGDRHGPPLLPALERDLRELVGLSRWRVLGREGGALPLSDQPWPRQVGHRVLRIGVAGGRLKPSSGYAFTRILADNAAILASLRAHGHPFALPRARARYRWFDGVLLERLLAAPELGPELFAGLFRRCSTDAVFALLDEQASLGQLVAIMRSMPHKLGLALAGLRRSLAWLRAPGAPVLPAAPERAQLPPSP
jgi:lycopene beta-cyclase